VSAEPPVLDRSIVSAASGLIRTWPPRQWLWENWIPRAVTNVLYGDGGTGKSRLAQQLAAARAPFLGRPVEQRRGLCLSCEDDEDELLRRRVERG
jgi:RecA-family ATPase